MIDYARYDSVRAVAWQGDRLELLDQRELPFRETFVACRSAADVADAIRALVVRGAPAIGIAAAWGVVLAARELEADTGPAALSQLEPVLHHLHQARPTAVRKTCGTWQELLSAAAFRP